MLSKKFGDHQLAFKRNFKKAEARLDVELSKHVLFIKLEQKTGMRKSMIVLMSILAFIVIFLWDWLTSLLMCAVDYTYPALMTMEILAGSGNSNNALDVSHVRQWLSYWTILGALHFFDVLSGNMPAKIVPLWTIIRAFFILWLQLPSTTGATFIWFKITLPLWNAIAPFFGGAQGRYVKVVHSGFSSVNSSVRSATASLTVSKSPSLVTEHLVGRMKKAIESSSFGNSTSSVESDAVFSESKSPIYEEFDAGSKAETESVSSDEKEVEKSIDKKKEEEEERKEEEDDADKKEDAEVAEE